jgi:uncharacterized membrane protein
MNMMLFAAAANFFGFEVPITTLLTYGSGVFVLLFALPTYISLIRQRGPFLATVLVGFLGACAVAFETMAVKTSIPYGKYAYDSVLGNKVIDGAPWTIGIAFPLLLLAAFWLASKITSGFFRPLLTAFFTVLTTLILDPAAVKLELWKWETAGPYFGAPYTHLIGWFIAGLAGAWFIQMFWVDKEVKRGVAYSGTLMMWFWTGVNLGVGQIIPAAIGLAVSIVLFVVMFLEKRTDKATSK